MRPLDTRLKPILDRGRSLALRSRQALVNMVYRLWQRLPAPIQDRLRQLWQRTQPLRARLNLPRTYPVYLLLVVLATLGIYMGSHQQGGVKGLLQPVKMDPHIELQFQGVTMHGMDKGTPRWTIHAPLVTASQNQQVVNFEDHPTGVFLNLKNMDSATQSAGPQHHKVRWTADSAQYDSFGHTMTIMGHAVFHTDQHDVLKAPEVIFHSQDHQVQIPARFVMDGHDQTTVQADQATADTSLEVLDLKGHCELTEPLHSPDNPLSGVGG